MKTVLGFIGGSGLYDLPASPPPNGARSKAPGAPADDILFAEPDGLTQRFLPRQGLGHPLSPSDINFRANIDPSSTPGSPT